MNLSSPRDRRRRILGPGIVLTPLLDVILNLVFFFLVATEIRKTEVAMEVKLPASETASLLKTKDRPAVLLDAQGKIYFRGLEVTENELESAMRGIVAGGTTEMDIRGDAQVNLGKVVHLMDVCRRAGLKAVNFDAEKKTQP